MTKQWILTWLKTFKIQFVFSCVRVKKLTKNIFFETKNARFLNKGKFEFLWFHFFYLLHVINELLKFVCISFHLSFFPSCCWIFSCFFLRFIQNDLFSFHDWCETSKPKITSLKNFSFEKEKQIYLKLFCSFFFTLFLFPFLSVISSR